MAKDTITRKITLSANGKGAEQTFESLSRTVKRCETAMKRLAEAGKSDSAEYKAFKRIMQDCTKDLKDNEIELHKVEKVMADLGGATNRQLRGALRELKKEMDNLSESSGKLPQLRKQMRDIQEQIDKNTGSLKKQGNAFTSLLKHGAQMVAMYASLNAVKNTVEDVVKKNLELSDSLANVRKVSGLDMQTINGLSKSLQKIDTRVAQEQMNQLAYAGAKLGLGEYGASGLEQYARAAAQLQMALGEDMGDDALTQLAKMAQVMGDMKHLGVDQSLMAIGSAIFKLSTTTTSTGSNIMQFAERLTGLGKTANLTSDEILALGSAADSMGLMPEVASTAFNKFIGTLQSKYGQIGKAVGIPPETLQSLLEAGKTMDAIVMVLERMHSMGNLNAIMPIMGDLGGEGARMANVFAAMAQNVSMLEDQLKTSKSAFSEATAVTNEFNIQNETAAALMERAGNMWEKMIVNPDSVDTVKQLAQAWYDVTKAMTGNQAFVGSLTGAFKTLVFIARSFVELLPEITAFITVIAAQKAWVGFLNLTNSALGAFGSSWKQIGLNMEYYMAKASGMKKQFLEETELAQMCAESNYSVARSNYELANQNYKLATTEEELAAAQEQLLKSEEALTATKEQLVVASGHTIAATGAECEALTEGSFALGGYITEEERAAIATEANQVATSEETATLMAKKGVTLELTKSTEEQSSAIKGLGNNSMWMMGIVSLLVVNFVNLIQKLTDLNDEEKETQKTHEAIAEAVATANSEYQKEYRALNDLTKQLRENWNNLDTRRSLIDQINSRYGDYLQNLLSEKDGYDSIRASIGDATDALRQYYYYKQKEELRGELVEDVRKGGTKSYVQLQQSDERFSNINLDWLDNAIKDISKTAKNSKDITDELWKNITGESAPSKAYLDMRKLPVVGHLTDGMYKNRDNYNLLNELVLSRVRANKNEQMVETNFPGEFKPQTHTVSYIDNSKQPKANNSAEQAEWRKELKSVQQDAEGLVNNVKAFFTRQLTEQTNYATSQNMSEAEKTAYMEPMNRQMQTTLAQLQMALSGHKNTWTDLSSALPSQILEKDDETGYNASRELAEAINKTKPEELYKKLVELSAHLEKPITATVAQWVKGASNADQTNAQADYKAQQARQQAALERNYTGKVQQTYTDQMYQYGFADMVSADKHDEQKAAMVDMFETARKHIAELMAMEPSDKNGILSLLFGTSKAPKDSMLKNVFALEGEDIKTFYETLIKYSDAYTEAEQKAYEKQKAIMEQRYALRQKDQEKLEQFYERFNKLYGASQSFGSRLGLVRANPDKDPEIQLYKSKMEFAKAYYDFVMKNSKNVQLQRAAENSMLQAQDAYSEQLVVKMKDRISKLQSFMQPTEEAIESLGDAWAEFQTSTEDGQKAMINVLKTLIKSYATMVIKNLRELAEKKLTDKMTESITGVPSELKEARSTDSMVLAEKQNFYKVRLEMEREFQQQLADIRNAYSEAHGLSPYKPKEKTEQPATEQPATEQSSEEQTYWKADEGWEGMKEALSPENEATPYDETKGPLAPAESEGEKQDALTEAVGEDADPTETLRTYDEAVLAETAHFHEQMLEEEQWYQEQLQAIKGGDISDEDKLQAVIDQHEQEREQQQADYDYQLEAKKESDSDIFSATKKGGKKLLSLMKSDDKKKEQETAESYAEQLSIVQDTKTGEVDWVRTAEETLTNILTQMIQSRTQAKQQETQQQTAEDVTQVTGEVATGVAGGAAKTVESMGVWGLVLIPVITAALMALLTWALSSLGSGGSSSSGASTNTKLVSGMLTYDEGNVQSFQGTDGHSYTATQVSQLSTGVVTSPIATTVNGVPSLVGEKGPEIVVGRETTAAIQRNDPELLSTLVNYDRLYSGRHRMRTLDEGNVSEVTSPLSSGEGRGEASDMTQLMSSILYYLQNPVAPNINMYGRDGLHDKIQRANAFMKGKA